MALNTDTAAYALSTTVTATSLHSADPGTTGTSEISGGTYARKVPTFAEGALSDGKVDLAASLVFNVPGTKSITYYGHWVGARFLGGGVLSSPETYGADGTYTLTSAAVTVS